MIKIKTKPATEVRKEDDLYFVGPFWIVGNSLKEIFKGNYKILSEKSLYTYDGLPVKKVSPSNFTHKGIWEKKYKLLYNNVDFDYYPRGRVSEKEGKSFLNIPETLNKDFLIKALQKEYDLKTEFYGIKFTDPTSGNHYNFKLR